MRISDWSSDVCSSDLIAHRLAVDHGALGRAQVAQDDVVAQQVQARVPVGEAGIVDADVRVGTAADQARLFEREAAAVVLPAHAAQHHARIAGAIGCRSEEHTSELQSLMRISYAV